MLHKDATPAVEVETTGTHPAPTAINSVASAAQKPVDVQSGCLPRTVLGLGSAGSYIRCCRAQLDTGAMLSLVTQRQASSIQARRLRENAVTISGVGGGELHSTHEVEFQLQSLYFTESITVRASVVDVIPDCVSTGSFTEPSKIDAFKDFQLADPQFSLGARMDLLLGITHCNACSLPGIVLSQDKGHKAELTIFGRAVGGSSLGSPSDEATSTCLKMAPTQDNVGELLQRVWALEEVPGDGDLLTSEELIAVSSIRETHTRSENGRYMVGLPKRIHLCLWGSLGVWLSKDTLVMKGH